MDLDMTVIDGYEATRKTKKIYPNIPVIALTAEAFDEMRNHLVAKGINEVVQKPFTPAELLTKSSALVK
jgi:CheY-like chemotaxis protein